MYDGCQCMHMGGHVPCSYCASLSETEVAISDARGAEVLIWLQTHYLLINGEWDYEEGAEEFKGITLEQHIGASIRTAEAEIALREERKKQQSSAYDLAMKELYSNPPVQLIHIGAGVHVPLTSLPSAIIYDLALFRKERKRGTPRTP